MSAAEALGQAPAETRRESPSTVQPLLRGRRPDVEVAGPGRATGTAP